MPSSNSEALRVRLIELEREYNLATMGLSKGLSKAALTMVSGLITLGAALFAFITRGPGFLTGWHLVAIFGILAFAVIIYFSFVFGRAAKLRAEISKTRKLLEISSGEKVR